MPVSDVTATVDLAQARLPGLHAEVHAIRNTLAVTPPGAARSQEHARR